MMSTRLKWFIPGVSVLLFLLLTLPAGAKQNIVLIVADDLSLQLGCYGDTMARTPHLDALAAEGMVFKKAFATTASCSASRSVLLSGLHNHLTGQYGHAHAEHHFTTFDWVQSLPVILSRAGYRTAQVGKLHVAPESVYRFDSILGAGCRNSIEMADQCLPFLKENSTKPFFLYYCSCDPHRSGVYGKEGLKPDLFGNETRHSGVEPMEFDPEKLVVPSFLPDNLVTRAELAQYYQSITRLDQGVGRLVQHLKESGQYENTLIVFTSDNGMAFAGAKTTVYEPGLHVPFIVRGPGVEQGKMSDALVSLVDVTPTLLQFAGIFDPETGAVPPSYATPRRNKNPAGYQFHGRSFFALLKNPGGTVQDLVFASHTFHEVTMYYPMRVVRTGRFKLIWNIAHSLPYPFASDLWESPTWQEVFQKGESALYGQRTVREYIHRPRFELYDLVQDPGETKNLANDASYRERLEIMQDHLKKFQRRTEDPWILKWNYE